MSDFYEENVTTVDYQILFTKRDYEAVLEKGTTVVAKAMTSSGFASWKIAQFMTNLPDGIDIPASWDGVLKDIATVKDGKVIGIESDQLDNLQVEYQILSTLERKDTSYEKDQVDALNKIASKIKC